MNLLMGIAKRIGKAHYSLQLVTNDAFDVGSCDGYIITGVRKKTSIGSTVWKNQLSCLGKILKDMIM
ncbi:hypothetical protein EfmAA242_12590 [Enterococcus faecium]|nr:hypothetical protein EfmAA242_12590 [Enterococcus faecium]